VTVEVLNTGTELLLGRVVNTHVAFFGEALFPLGLRISRQTTVPDGPPILSALAEAIPRCDILLVTGGLGPTTDDVTREMAAQLLGLRLVEDPDVLKTIQDRFARRGLTWAVRNARQAMVPEGAAVLPNPHGTAPGLHIPPHPTPSRGSPHLFLLPGPPRELKPMFEDHVIPRLRAISEKPDVICQTYRIIGMGESALEERIGLALVARRDIEVGYCARLREVDLRLIGRPEALEAVDADVRLAVGDCLAGMGDESLESLVVNALRARSLTITVAESCTGGLLANRITNVPGASGVFMESFVTYANEAKERRLGVPPDLLSRHGAVSEPVARAMAEGALEAAGADFAIGITGTAGPSGGTPDKPVGTVFIALAHRGGSTSASKEFFPGERESFKFLATQTALNMVRLELANHSPRDFPLAFDAFRK